MFGALLHQKKQRIENVLKCNHKRKEKIADYLLDISKLIFAGVVLSTILQVEGVSKLVILSIGIYATMIFSGIAFMLIRRK